MKIQKKSTRELFEAIERALNEKTYYFTAHALNRSQERSVSEFQVILILRSKTKYHESKKDSFNNAFKAWNYSIRGETVDYERIRIIVSFDSNEMLIVTVINLDEDNE